MKPNVYPKFILAVAAAFMMLQSFAITEESNRIDEKGQRQGYWIILGSMIDDREYKPESVVEEGNYSDNRKHGLWKRYWPSGKLRSEIHYRDGRPEGEYKTYYASGRLEEHSTWFSNHNTGDFKRYHTNGNLHQAFVFAENGKRNGIQRYYHENGRLAMEVNIVNGKESGTMKRYNPDGSLAEEKVFDNGNIKASEGRVYKEVEKAPVSASDPYDPSVGKASKVTTDKTNKAQAFKPNGFNTLYDKNGQITQVGEFRDGRLSDGKWYRYNSEGILIRVEVYRAGRFIGSGVASENDK